MQKAQQEESAPLRPVLFQYFEEGTYDSALLELSTQQTALGKFEQHGDGVVSVGG